MSGGGGWGSKQGLLSLDPQRSYTDNGEAKFDFSNGLLEEQQASVLTCMAQPGAYIQFFVADSSKTNHRERLPEPANLSNVDLFQKSLVIGTVPSTIDDVPKSQQSSEQGVSGAKSSSIMARLGHFGFVSESGMFLSHTEVDSSHSDEQDEIISPDINTKIDLPYSYFYRDTWNRPGEGRSSASVETADQTELEALVE